ncbi:hypothetical protein VPH35_095716 [Triticum aestivum]|uniref:Uncharacterized protein n=1 Tax=Aegilops tauschii TaxID=37682 RepID=M8BW21_AEGTA
MSSDARRPAALLQIALLVVVAAVIMNSSVCLGAAVGTGDLDPTHPTCGTNCPSSGQPYGRRCSKIYGCSRDGPPATAGDQP